MDAPGKDYVALEEGRRREVYCVNVLRNHRFPSVFPEIANGVPPNWPLDIWLWGGLSAYAQIEVHNHYYWMVMPFPLYVLAWYLMRYLAVVLTSPWPLVFVVVAVYLLHHELYRYIFHRRMKDVFQKEDISSRFHAEGYAVEYTRAEGVTCSCHISSHLTLRPIDEEPAQKQDTAPISGWNQGVSGIETKVLLHEPLLHHESSGSYNVYRPVLPAQVDIWAWGALVETLRTVDHVEVKDPGRDCREYGSGVVLCVGLCAGILWLPTIDYWAKIVLFWALWVCATHAYAEWKARNRFLEKEAAVKDSIRSFSSSVFEQKTGLTVEFVTEQRKCMPKRAYFLFQSRPPTLS